MEEDREAWWSLSGVGDWTGSSTRRAGSPRRALRWRLPVKLASGKAVWGKPPPPASRTSHPVSLAPLGMSLTRNALALIHIRFLNLNLSPTPNPSSSRHPILPNTLPTSRPQADIRGKHWQNSPSSTPGARRTPARTCRGARRCSRRRCTCRRRKPRGGTLRRRRHSGVEFEGIGVSGGGVSSGAWGRTVNEQMDSRARMSVGREFNTRDTGQGREMVD